MDNDNATLAVAVSATLSVVAMDNAPATGTRIITNLDCC